MQKNSKCTQYDQFRKGERIYHDLTAFDFFTKLQADGKDIAESSYEKEKGSLIIKLKPAYLETLDAGKHTLTTMYGDGGKASAEFTIANKKPEPKKEEKKKSANTSEPFDPVLWGLSGTVALLGVIVLHLYRKELQSNH